MAILDSKNDQLALAVFKLHQALKLPSAFADTSQWYLPSG